MASHIFFSPNYSYLIKNFICSLCHLCMFHDLAIYNLEIMARS